MKLLIPLSLVLISWFIPSKSYTQASTTPTIDSLERVLPTLTDTTERIATLLELSHFYYCSSKAQSYAQRAYQLSSNLQDTMVRMNLYFRLSWVAYCNGSLDSATYWLDKVFLNCKKNNNHDCLYQYYLRNATYISYYPESELIHTYFQKSYYHAQKTGNPHYISTVLNNWSILFLKEQEYSSAKIKLEKGVSFIDHTFNLAQKGRLYYNLARAYKGCGQTSKAIDYFLKAYTIRSQDVNPAAIGEVYVRLAELLIEDTLQQHKDKYSIIFKILQIDSIPLLLDAAYQKAIKVNATGLSKPIYENQIRYYQLQNNYKVAFKYLERLKKLEKKVLLSEQNLEGLVDVKSKYEKQILQTKILKAELKQKKNH